MKETNSKPLISIVVRCCNNAADLPQCFDSITAQTYDNIEVCFIDCASSDNSLEIAVDYQQEKQLPMTLLNYRDDLFSDRFMNQCLNTMRGKYFISLRAESWLKPDLVEKCVEMLKNHPETAYVAFNWFNVASDGSRTAETPLYSYNCIVPGNEHIHNLVQFTPLCLHTSFAMMAAALKAPDLYEAQLSACIKKSVAYISEPLFYYKPGKKNDDLGVNESMCCIVKRLNQKLSVLNQCHKVVKLPNCRETMTKTLQNLSRTCLLKSIEFAIAENREASEQLGCQAVAIYHKVKNDAAFYRLKRYWSGQDSPFQSESIEKHKEPQNA